MKKIVPGIYTCKFYLFDKISPGRKPDPMYLLTHAITLVPDYYLVSRRYFNYVVK